MKIKALWKKVKYFFKSGLDELITQIKMLPYYFLLAALLILALQYLPDYLITHVKPEHLDESDAVTFYCAIITALATLAGIMWTLNHNQKMVQDQLKQNHEKFEEERRLSVLPVIAISDIKTGFQNSNVVSNTLRNHLGIAFEYANDDTINSIIDAGNKINRWEEANPDEIVFSFTETKIDERQQLTYEQKEMINSLPIRLTGYQEFTPYVHMPYTLTNTGLGAAVNLFIFIEKLVVENGEAKSINIHISGAKNLKSGQEFRLSFFAEKYEYLNEKFTLVLRYNDVFGNAYEQKHIFNFYDDIKLFVLEPFIYQNLTKKVELKQA